ncbi:hypothetical protein [Streptomyces beihaiensis]|uniref:Uncharacterized protein n=1 Tax=Streptomyces beihaiensis TaxID=2984495 RepID=A0ABT3U1G6_9ACTN|nr:hypothetical protein [Streptomyces beihaiensis]MCX3063161.1 hypothetical protein [Streptomyces beihaiensis]
MSLYAYGDTSVQACGCGGPVDVVLRISSLAIEGLALAFVGVVCLCGLTLGAVSVAARLVRGGRQEAEEVSGLDAFHWEADGEAGDAPE